MSTLNISSSSISSKESSDASDWNSRSRNQDSNSAVKFNFDSSLVSSMNSVLKIQIPPSGLYYEFSHFFDQAAKRFFKLSD